MPSGLWVPSGASIAVTTGDSADADRFALDYSTIVSITQVAKLIGGALAPLLAVTVAGGAAAYGGYKYLK